MIIKEIRTTRLVAPYLEPPAFSPGFDSPRNVLVVDVEMDNGVVGMGYLMPLEGGLRTIETCIHEMFVPLLVGQDATRVEWLWKQGWQATYMMGRMGVTVMALSALDIALWDALGKLAGLPLWRLWGGYAPEVPAYGSGCWRGLGGEGMIDRAQLYVTQGFSAIKMQAGHLHSLADDASHVRRMRAALGDSVDILIDINMGWTADTAILMGRKFEEHGVYWMEEPVPAEDIDGYRRVAAALDMRVVGGENHWTRYDLRPFFTQPCSPILQPDPMRGGLTELRKIATLADTWGLKMAPHLFHELNVQVMASIPNPLLLEYLNFLDDLWVHPVLPERGVITAPERPGHGLAFKPDALREYTQRG